MTRRVRAGLLSIAGLLMFFAAAAYAVDLLPDLQGDLVSIHVRPTVLVTTILYLHFAGLAMFGFALIVSAAAVQAMRGAVPPRMSLGTIAVVYAALGLTAFSRSHSLHHLGPVAIGALIAAAIAIPDGPHA